MYGQPHYLDALDGDSTHIIVKEHIGLTAINDFYHPRIHLPGL